MTEKKPHVTHSLSEKELDKAEAQFEKFDSEIKAMTLDRMNEAPRLEEEKQTEMSSREQKNSKDIYLKPIRTLSSKEQFNEKFRKDYEFKKEYVHFIAENKEIIGEDIEPWTKPFPGIPAEQWSVPTNKPVWGPRYLAEQIKGKCYHRLVMREYVGTGGDHMGQYYGSMAADTTIQRLDAYPVAAKRSVFMSA